MQKDIYKRSVEKIIINDDFDVAFEGKVDQRDLERQDVLQAQVRLLLDHLADVLREGGEGLDPVECVGVVDGVHGETVHQAHQDVFDVHTALELRARVEEGVERRHVQFVGEDLDQAVHQVLLGNEVLARGDLLQSAREDDRLVKLFVDAFQLRKPYQVGPDQDPQVAALLLPPLLVPDRALALHADLCT